MEFLNTYFFVGFSVENNTCAYLIFIYFIDNMFFITFCQLLFFVQKIVDICNIQQCIRLNIANDIRL